VLSAVERRVSRFTPVQIKFYTTAVDFTVKCLWGRESNRGWESDRERDKGEREIGRWREDRHKE
jgi:hypothetical protein